MTRRYDAWLAYRAARQQEHDLHGRAEVHREAHGTYPAEYLTAKQATADAFAAYLDAPSMADRSPEPEAGS